MSEEQMVELVNRALESRGIADRVVVAGQFNPRGHTGGRFAGGMVGGDMGGLAGGVGVAAGSLAGARAADAASGLPSAMLVAVSETMIYGLAAATRHSEPTEVVFGLRRADVSAKVHQRVNVRVLELIDATSGARIELEGNRVPLTHAKDVIQTLTG